MAATQRCLKPHKYDSNRFRECTRDSFVIKDQTVKTGIEEEDTGAGTLWCSSITFHCRSL